MNTKSVFSQQFMAIASEDAPRERHRHPDSFRGPTQHSSSSSPTTAKTCSTIATNNAIWLPTPTLHWKQQLSTLQNEVIPQQEARLQSLKLETEKLLGVEAIDKRMQEIKEIRQELDLEEERLSGDLREALESWRQTRFGVEQ
ncbi:hypothetical protein BGX24_006631 [Mortierella sp. AD032]|nr:hypothetical protein BGX24_006631 [Mortierella sp. AD032]